MAGVLKSRSVTLLSVLSMVATLLSTAPLPAAASSHASVATATQLTAALANGSGDIQITASFALDNPVTISRNVAIFAEGAKAETFQITAPPNSPAFVVSAGKTVTLKKFGIKDANDRKAKGGAISVSAGATLTLDMMSIHDNFAGEGGGLYNAGTTTIKNSVFYKNGAAGKGGGVSNDGTLTVVNSTFAKNDAQQGGAVSTAGATSVNFATIVGNSSKNKIGAGINLTGGSVDMKRSIVANNYSGGSFYDCSGQTTVTEVLFSSTQGCQPNGTYKTVATISFPNSELPMDNGGPTKTVALTDQTVGAPFDHPAHKYGTVCLPADQRGSGRPSSMCTVGAFEPDFTPPSIVLTQNPVPNTSGWHGSTVPSVEIVIAATDSGSGVATTEYRTNPASGWSPVPVAGLFVTTEGTKIIEVRATDYDGNMSNIVSTTVKIDRTAPAASYTIAPNGSSVTFTVTDGGSGIAGFTVGGIARTLDGSGNVTIATNMAASLAYKATDNAGNETLGTVDVKAPDVDILRSPPPNAAGWHQGSVAVNISSSDVGTGNTGVKSLTYQASGATNISSVTITNPPSFYPIATDAPITVNGEGTTTVTASAKDADGNVGLATPLEIKIDETVPTVFVSTTADAQTGDVVMTFHPADALSGVATLSYSLDGGAWITVLDPAASVDSAVVSASGDHEVRYEAVDLAGNGTGYVTDTFTIDPLTLTASLTTSSPTVQVGAVSAPLDSIVAGVAQLSQSGTSVSSTPFSAIPFSAITMEDAPFSAIPFSAIPFSAIPFSAIPFSAIANPQPGTFSIPFSAIPFSAIPFSAIPFSAIGLDGTPFSAIGLDSTLLSELSTPNGESLDAYLAGTPLAGTPLQALNLGDLMSVPFSAIDLSKSPFSAIPFSAIPFSAIDLSGVPFSAIPFSAIGDVLDCSGLSVEACRNLTLGQAKAQGRLITDGTDSLLTVGDVLGLDDVNLNSTVLANLPFSAIALGSVSLSGIPFSAINTNGTAVTGLTAWCEVLGSVCVDYKINPATGDDNGVSLITLALSGVDLNNVPFSAINLEGLPFSAIPLGLIPFSAINWESTPIGATPFSAIPFSAIPFSAIGDIVDCAKVNCATGTLADAQKAGAFKPAFLASPISLLEAFDLTGYSLADLLFGMLPPEDLPWIEIDDLNSVRLPIADGNQDTFNYVIDFTVGNRNADDVTVSLTLPVGFVPPLGAVATLDGVPTAWTESAPGTGSNPPLVLTFTELGPLDAGAYTITLPVWAGVVLGDFSATADAVATRSTATVTASDSESIQVTEAGEGLVSTQLELTGSGACLLNSDLEVSHISSSGDVDVYSFQVPATCTGGRIEVMMTNLAADLDLTLLGPPATAEYLRGTPRTGYGYIEDHTYDLNPDDDTLDADVLRDIPVDAAKLGLPAASTLVPIAVSANRGTASEQLEARTPRSGEPYYLVVSGYNGASTELPFGMQAQFTGTSSTTCTPPPLPSWTATNSDLPNVASLSPDVNTLFLYNAGRLEGSADSAAPGLLGAIAGIGSSEWTSLGVIGAAIPIDADPAVRAALAAWYSNVNGARCEPEAANEIVRGIGDLIDTYTAGPDGIASSSDDLPITNIVIVGDDSQVPFARLVDNVTYSNETDHAGTIPVDGELRGALAGGYYFSDDPYGSAAGIKIADGEFFVPDRAVGRLVETPTQILGQFNDFLTYGGVLDPTTGTGTLAAAAGYDFLKDGVDEIVTNMTADGFDFSPGVLNEQNGVLWDAQDLIGLLSVGGLSVASINAHFDQYRSLPSKGNATGNETSDLFVVDDVAGTNLSRALLFSMGCHAGLSVSNVQIGANPVWATDWAESFGGQGDLWIGNSGFGYGDSAMVAYSESISASFADFIGTNNVGQAWMLAKQDFASDMFVVSPYQTKSMNEWILYGFPMFRTSADIPVQPELPMIGSGPGVIADPYGSGLDIAPVGLASTNLELKTTSAGNYYQGNAGTLEIRGRAVTALAEIDVTIPDGLGGLDLVAGGAIITGLTSESVPNFPALIFNPIVDLGDGENPDLSTSNRFPVPEAVFPAGLSQLVDHLGEGGQLRQSLLLAGTRYVPQGDGSTGRLEKFTSAQATVYYRPEGSTDTTPPLIRTAEGVSDGQIAFFAIDVAGDAPDDTLRVNVLFGPSNPTGSVNWRSIDLVKVGTKWVGGAPVDPAWGAAGSYAFWVQACDKSANCGSSTAKGVYFATTDTGGGNIVTINIAATETNGWYPGAVSAVASSTAGLIDRYVLDGVALDVTNVASLAIPVSGPGGHFLLVYDDKGNIGARLLAIDGTPPIANHSINPAPINGFNGSAATVAISALDPFGSGVDRIEHSTDGFVTKTSVSGPFALVAVSSTSTVSYRAVDRVGNMSSIVDVTITIDTTAPIVAATAGTGINGGWSKTAPVSVELVATDAGVGTVASTEYSLDGSNWTTYVGPFDVSAEGTTTIHTRSTDILGNRDPSDDVVVRIDTFAPTATITAPSGAYDQGATVNAAFTCTDPGTDRSDVATCVGTVANGLPFDTSTVGNFTFTVTATDNAGNETETQSTYTVADVTAPIITITNPPTAGTTVELGASTTAAYTCFDDVDPAPTCDGTVGAAPVASGAALPSSAVGHFTLTVTSRDQAGNTSTKSANYQVIDTTAPTVTISTSPAPIFNSWNKGTVTVTITATDASGASPAEYQTALNGGTLTAWTPYTGPFTIAAEGTTLIKARATDTSSNVSSPVSHTVEIDKTAPAISSTVPTAVIVGSTAPTVEFTCTDTGGSGVASCTSVPALGTALSTATPGTVSFTVSAVDNVGNATQKTFTMAVKYKVCLLYNANKPQPATGAVAIKVQLCNASNQNLSSSSITLTATAVDLVMPVEPQDSGSSNPTFEFRYDANLAGYIYNLQVPNLAAGAHTLNFVVSTTGTAVYEAKFTLK